MAIHVCPNCNYIVDADDVICPHCFSWIKKDLTKIRIRVHLSGEQDVFSMSVYGLVDRDTEVCYGHVRFDNGFGGDYEVVISRHFDKLGIMFEEHWTDKSYSFQVDKILGKECGIEFFEKKTVYDKPTYAGGFTYYHPEFIYKEVPYSSINNSPKIINLEYNNCFSAHR